MALSWMCVPNSVPSIWYIYRYWKVKRLTCCWHYTKSWTITKVIWIHPLGTVDVYVKFHSKKFNSCWVISQIGKSLSNPKLITNQTQMIFGDLPLNFKWSHYINGESQQLISAQKRSVTLNPAARNSQRHTHFVCKLHRILSVILRQQVVLSRWKHKWT